jgi:uncharacterized membrane protein
MRLRAAIDIAAPREAVWEQVCDPERVLRYMSGVTRWEPANEVPPGPGARYRTLMLVGSAEVGGTVEVVEWREPSDLAWHSVTGIDQRGRWRLRTRPGDRTRAELSLAYGVVGSGPFGWLAERLAAPTVRGHLKRSVARLKRQVENEERRRQAAVRRAQPTA